MKYQIKRSTRFILSIDQYVAHFASCNSAVSTYSLNLLVGSLLLACAAGYEFLLSR